MLNSAVTFVFYIVMRATKVLNHTSICGAFITDGHSPEYLMMVRHYSKLVDTLTAKNLSHHFVSRKVISTKDQEEILNPTTSSVWAATVLLRRVINPLKAGYENCTDNFYVFLDIAEEHGSDSIGLLVATIRKEVSEIKTMTNVKGMCILMKCPVMKHTNICSVVIHYLGSLFQ